MNLTNHKRRNLTVFRGVKPTTINDYLLILGRGYGPPIGEVRRHSHLSQVTTVICDDCLKSRLLNPALTPIEPEGMTHCCSPLFQ